MTGLLSCSLDKITEITPEEVREIISKDAAEEYVLVDVRTPDEYTEGHLPGARLIPLPELDYRKDELAGTKNIITYCRSGKRSLAGAILLCNQGVTELHNMVGGMLNWSYEIVQGPFEEAQAVFGDKEEIKDLLLFAIQMEQTSESFYQHASQHVDEELSGFLLKLAHAEQRHQDTLHDRLREIWPQAPLPGNINMNELMEGGISFPHALADWDEHPPDERMDILEFALEKESKAFDLYHRMADQVEEPLKGVFRDLARQERRHIDEISRYL